MTQIPSPAGASGPHHPLGLARFSLQGRVALVTGASQGLGFAIARAMTACGAQVVINGRDAKRLEHAAQRIVNDLGDQYPRPVRPDAAPFDVADEAAMRAAVAAIEQRHGAIDILVSNVGLRNRKPLGQFDAGEIRALLETDLVAATLLAQAVLPSMQARRHGRLVTVTSIAGLFGRGQDVIYTAAKHGLTGLVRALAAEFGRDGITSNAIAPGGFTTEHNAAAYADPAIRAHFEARTPMGRWGDPEEIAGAAVFLASDAAAYVNGHVLVVDGGMTAAM